MQKQRKPRLSPRPNAADECKGLEAYRAGRLSHPFVIVVAAGIRGSPTDRRTTGADRSWTGVEEESADVVDVECRLAPPPPPVDTVRQAAAVLSCYFVRRPSMPEVN